MRNWFKGLFQSNTATALLYVGDVNDEEPTASDDANHTTGLLHLFGYVTRDKLGNKSHYRLPSQFSDEWLGRQGAQEDRK